jgi:hypothetical protein
MGEMPQSLVALDTVDLGQIPVLDLEVLREIWLVQAQVAARQHQAMGQEAEVGSALLVQEVQPVVQVLQAVSSLPNTHNFIGD